MIRSAYPDELARAKSLLDNHPVPSAANFLVSVKQHPVERINAVIPWWKVAKNPQQKNPKKINIRYYLATSIANSLSPQDLHNIQTQLETIAKQENASAIYTDSSLPEDHPIHQSLTLQGYQICQTDRHFSIPAALIKSHSLPLYQQIKNRLPSHWQVQSIRGYDPAKIFNLIAKHQLMSLQQFKNYWKSDRGESFEADYSFIVLDQEEPIGLLLLSRRGQQELHIHIECVHPDYMTHSATLSATLRHASLSQCPQNFPEVFTCRADALKHKQIINSAIKQQASEAPHRHFLKKILSP